MSGHEMVVERQGSQLRMGELQTGNPNPLRLRHVVPGGRTDEKKLHYRFREARIRGEWFGLSYLSFILVYAEGLAENQIESFQHGGEDALPVLPKADEPAFTEKDRHRFRQEIERLWLKGMDPAEMASFNWLEMDQPSMEDIKAELKEMRKSTFWDVGPMAGAQKWKRVYKFHDVQRRPAA